jgi:methylmalonyl-CoA mutase C-terminal domain/subunit
VLVEPGLDGHDRGAKVVAAALRDAGMEVIYTGLHQTPEQIVEAAVQEDVDLVALSILSGAHMTLFPEVLRLMRERGIGDRLLTGGGIVPAEDMQSLSQQGVGKLFGPGSSTQDIVHYIREWFAERHGAAALPPLPPPPPARPLEFAGATPRPASAPRKAAAARPVSRQAALRKSAPKRSAAGRTAASAATGRTAARATKSAPAPRRTAAKKPAAARAARSRGKAARRG